MSVLIVFAIVLLLLFALAFITKRRFGVLGLALAAGSMISELWAAELTPLVRDAGLVVQNPPLITVVSVALVLLPAAVLLFNGPSYVDLIKRIIGATLFAVLAFALIIEPLGSAMVIFGTDRTVYDLIFDNRVYIVTIGLVIAIIDILTTRSPKSHKASKH